MKAYSLLVCSNEEEYEYGARIRELLVGEYETKEEAREDLYRKYVVLISTEKDLFHSDNFLTRHWNFSVEKEETNFDKDIELEFQQAKSKFIETSGHTCKIGDEVNAIRTDYFEKLTRWCAELRNSAVIYLTELGCEKFFQKYPGVTVLDTQEDGYLFVKSLEHFRKFYP